MPSTNSDNENHTNYYICHTPYHFYQASLIARQYFHKDINIAIIEGDAKTKTDFVFKKTIRLAYVGGSVFKAYNKIEKSVDAIVREIDNVPLSRIFLSDIAWPLCNRIYFNRNLNKCEFNFLSDGVAAYLDKKRSTKQLAKDTLKGLLSNIFITSKYKNFYGHALGYDHAKAKGFYVPNPSIIKYAVNNIHEVKLSQTLPQKIQDTEKNILFLDQPFWLLMENSWPQKIERTIKHIKTQFPEHNLFFKKHHRSRENESILFSKNGFKELENNYCIEELVFERKYDVIISFYSSALLHLRWILPKNTILISLTDNEIIEKLSINSELTNLYKQNDITTEHLI